MRNLFIFLFSILWFNIANAQWSSNPGYPYKVVVDGGAKHTALTSDGRIYVTWGNPKLSLILLNADGTVAEGWPANGLRVLPNVDEASSFSDFGMSIFSDNSAFLAYCDSRNGIKPHSPDNQIFQPFAYKVSDRGISLWENGIMLQDTREIDPFYNKSLYPKTYITNDGNILSSWSYFKSRLTQKWIKLKDKDTLIEKDTLVDVYVDDPYSKIVLLDPNNGDIQWENPITIDSTYFPTIISSDKNNFIVAYKKGKNDLIYASKYSGFDGSPIWENKQLGNLPIANGAEVLIASDGQGGAIVSWQSTGTNSNYAVCQRITSSGLLTMGIDGLTATDETSTKHSGVQMSVDSKNQIVYLQWVNTLLSEYCSFHVQAIDFNGEYLFSSKGIKLTADRVDLSDMSDYECSGISNTGDGVICFYGSVRQNDTGLKAAYITKEGSVQWNKQISTVEKTTGVATPFFNGQAVVLWAKNGSLYGQNVHKDGTIGASPSAINKTSISDFCKLNQLDGSIQIQLDMQDAAQVKIDAYNLCGQKMATIANQNVTAGNNEFNWGTSNLSKGVYLLSISINSEVQTVKVTL